jgi:hypothetical protein
LFSPQCFINNKCLHFLSFRLSVSSTSFKHFVYLLCLCSLSASVTRLDEFSPTCSGWLLTLGICTFLKITEVAHILRLLYSTFEVCNNFVEKCFGRFFSRAHPVTLLSTFFSAQGFWIKLFLPPFRYSHSEKGFFGEVSTEINGSTSVHLMTFCLTRFRLNPKTTFCLTTFLSNDIFV